ncbi:Pr6Pr family membrane protein [uncultured Friedmanniella sp.]|uniref:Pr6Pr family membrane protein n=1 Tax=uncultured Friedmanniella sp. TaxID=335381 RepID=UPI0035CAB385
MTSTSAARLWHTVTALAAAAGLGTQLVLVVTGASVLVEDRPPGLAARLLHFVSYFTVLSNLLVLLTTAAAARRPTVDGRLWRVLRLDAVVGITVTGLVHWFFLRPLLQLTGWPYVTDKVLHVVVPLLAVVGWLLVGPRPRITLRVVLLGLIYPVGWLVYTLVIGAATGWYPYPFIDVGARGGAAVAVTSVALALLILAFSVLAWLADRRWPPTPRDLPTGRP